MNLSENGGFRVKSIHAKKLFGMYDHEIVLKPDHVTIVYGRNGVGKTVLFKLTYATLEGNILSAVDLLCYPYEEFCIEFANNEKIKVIPSKDKEISFQYEDANGKELKSCKLEFEYILNLAKRLERMLPIERIASNRWVYPETSETMDAVEVVRRWGKIGEVGETHQLLSEWQKFLRARPILQPLFIQAQRLIQVANVVRDGHLYYRRGEEPAIRETVLEYSADLKKRIEQMLANYGRQAQALDQTYPQRLLQTETQNYMDRQEVQSSLGEMRKQQDEFQQLGILGEAGQLPVADKPGQDQGDQIYLAAMTLYVQDTNTKLKIVSQLADRIRLMLKLISAKFSNKKLKIDQESHDLVVCSTLDDHSALPVSTLSSGEQHQLVLAYELLFRTQPNTLVLIDEPELSLHVEWQERFLTDLKEVLNLVPFDVLLATHSPYIINGHNELTVPLSTQVTQ
ncbi:MAG: AAA family ATPase [Gammaproteobacteria bacterium]|nr:AAA family ATPase [Gammaproteobacteria bacterium]